LKTICCEVFYSIDFSTQLYFTLPRPSLPFLCIILFNWNLWNPNTSIQISNICLVLTYETNVNQKGIYLGIRHAMQSDSRWHSKQTNPKGKTKSELKSALQTRTIFRSYQIPWTLYWHEKQSFPFLNLFQSCKTVS